MAYTTRSIHIKHNSAILILALNHVQIISVCNQSNTWSTTLTTQSYSLAGVTQQYSAVFLCQWREYWQNSAQDQQMICERWSIYSENLVVTAFIIFYVIISCLIFTFFTACTFYFFYIISSLFCVIQLLLQYQISHSINLTKTETNTTKAKPCWLHQEEVIAELNTPLDTIVLCHPATKQTGPILHIRG